MKMKVDETADKLKNDCETREKADLERIHAYQENISRNIDYIGMNVENYNSALSSGSHVQLYEIAEEIDNFAIEIQQKPLLITTSFESNTEANDLIEQALGSLNIGLADQHTSTLIKQNSATEIGMFSTQDEFTVVKSLALTNQISAICPSGTSLWILESTAITLMESKLTSKCKFELNKQVFDIAVSKTTGKVWIACSDKSIQEADQEDTAPIVKFYTDSKPKCIGVTQGGNLAIGTKGKVTLYTPEGSVKYSSFVDPTGQLANIDPKHIATCQETGQVAVANADSTQLGGKASPHVIVMTNKLELSYKYYGERTTESVENTCVTMDLTFDFQGNLLIAEYSSHSILVVDRHGHFLKTLLQNDILELIGFQPDNKLWIVEKLYTQEKKGRFFRNERRRNYVVKLLDLQTRGSQDTSASTFY